MRGDRGTLNATAMMNPFSATDLKRWVEENRHLYQPPYKTNHIVAHYNEFFVLVLNGPNARLDFHREPGEEFFFQIHGDIELHVKPEGERRQVVKIREGEMFLCPGGLAALAAAGRRHLGPRHRTQAQARGDRGVPVVLRGCDAEVLARTVVQGDTAAQVTAIYEAFNADPACARARPAALCFRSRPARKGWDFLEKTRES